MPRKRKRARAAREQAAPAAPKPSPHVATALGSLLKSAGIGAQPTKTTSKPLPLTLPPPGPEAPARVSAPPKAAPKAADLSTTELRMLNDAYEGARPLHTKNARAKPIEERAIAARSGDHDPALQSRERAEEIAARARLAALVSENVRFKIRREDGYVEALRLDTSPKLLARLQGRGFMPEAKLDLHGLRVNQVGIALERFLRAQHRRGARQVLVIVGKGLHSDTGVSQLGPAAIEALSQGLAAPWVIAFGSAHAVHGGAGALAVLLRD